MKIGSIIKNERIEPVIFVNDSIIEFSSINNLDGFRDEWYQNLDILIKLHFDEMKEWFSEHYEEISETKSISKEDCTFSAPYYNPSKIWGIGLNYSDHAQDLDEKTPNRYPASFMRPTTSIVGDGDTINIPKIIENPTGEAELGIIIGKKAKDIDENDWLDYVAGFTTIIDITAEDILRQNPRYLTLSKAFDSFFSFGPQIITPDELPKSLEEITVSTCYNDRIHAKNTISNMTFSPQDLVTFHSHVMTLLPGDIISTGTPRAIPLEDGSVIECRVDGFIPLRNTINFL